MKVFKCPFCNRQIEADEPEFCSHGVAKVLMKQVFLPFKPIKERATGFIDYDEVLSD